MKKTKIGRPTVPKAKYRGILMQARVSQEENNAILAAIERAEATKSDWIRKALLSAAGSSKPLS
jgi:hypothetical protein